MHKTAFFILTLVVLGVVIYLMIAVVKITIGLIILVIAAALLWFLWSRIKHKWEETFEDEPE
ncbi:MAG: hypothetical protein WCE57_08725 [Salegentibacter sp.]